MRPVPEPADLYNLVIQNLLDLENKSQLFPAIAVLFVCKPAPQLLPDSIHPPEEAVGTAPPQDSLCPFFL